MTNSSSRFRTSAHSSSSSSSSSTGGNSNVSGGSVAKHSSIREDEGETLDLAFGTVNAAVTHTSSANNSQLPFYSGYRAHTMALSEAEEDGKGHSSQVTAAPSYLIPGSGPKMSTNLDHSVNTKPLSKLLDMDALYATVTDNVRFMTLTALVVTFFAIHNYLQELIMSFDGFDVGIFLGYLEVLGVTVCTYVERVYTKENAQPRKEPLSAYGMLCLCLAISSFTSNYALNFINYPTKVVFRSCKLIPTMVLSTFITGRRVAAFEYAAGVIISIGMVAFAAADFQVLPEANFFGIILVLISITADSFLPNLQERYFTLGGASRSEVTYYTNFLALIGMTVFLTISGDIQRAVSFALSNSACLMVMGVYTFIAHVAITFHMTLVREFGGISAVLVGNFRKALTIYLSFLLFPKPQSVWYMVGAVLVFGGLFGQEYYRELLKHQNSARNSSNK